MGVKLRVKISCSHYNDRIVVIYINDSGSTDMTARPALSIASRTFDDNLVSDGVGDNKY